MTTTTTVNNVPRERARVRRNSDAHGSSPVGDVSLSLELKEYGSFEEVRAWRDAWDELATDCGADLFSTFDWCEAWWNHYGHGRSLRILSFLDDAERLVAVAPLFTERLGLGPVGLTAWRVVGCDHSVTTCGWMIRKGYEEAISRRFAERVSRDPSWDVIQIGSLPAYAAEGSAGLFEALSQCGIGKCELRDTHPHMYHELADSFDGYLEKISTSNRKKWKRDERKLAEQGEVVVERVGDGPEALAALREFIDLHQGQWREKGCLGHFGDWPDAEAFHLELARRMAARNRLLLVRVLRGGEVVASEYAYCFGARAHLILTTRAPGVPGRVGFMALVREAIAAGARQVDTLRGFYEHKKELGAILGSQKSIVIVAPRVSSRARLRLFEFGAKCLHLVYYRLWFSRLAKSLPLRRKPLWTSWIRSRL